MPRVNVIIPNYNGIKYLDDCLKSLMRQTFSDFDITVVDNASDDGSCERLKERWLGTRDMVKLIELSENTGFANAVNVGIRASGENKETAGEYVFLLNNDAFCDENALKSLVRVMDHKRKLFSAQGKMLQAKEP